MKKEELVKKLEYVKECAEELLKAKKMLMIAVEMLSEEEKQAILNYDEIKLLNAENKVLFKMI